MPRSTVHDDALRTRLLDHAGRLLAEHGAGALSMRRLASDAGTSTTAVYALFGNKATLVNELYAEGFRRLGLRLRRTETTGDTVDDVVRLGLAYRESALADRHLYPIMFADVTPGFEAGPGTDRLAMTALAPLWETVRAGVESGVLADAAVETIAVSCWACAHGMVAFELSRTLPRGFDFCTAYEGGLRATASGWCR
ncbi:TetR/AcrR family transcriptional regulator [Saccharomonospora saliphila]|uniref:TetR/AcrR family transcriptional regulator n=1 Tax=Saccharomonospora saliphila TaxID=369829 RepID=UPI00036CF8D8|nr:TetR/AcrR family transcriptional regulator [Saccharomonospora saliphila]